jgi:hypothetical protein
LVGLFNYQSLSTFDVQLCSSGDDDDGGGDRSGGGGDDDGDDDDGGDRPRLQMQVGYQLLDLTQTVILLPQLMQC